KDSEEECKRLVNGDVPLAAYDECLKASHVFNQLNALGVISVTERASYVLRVRHLAKICCTKWLEMNE
ncbi:MAG TPA: glycine--tRNA ligase subunit alpha, partial [Rickettsia endosymbiont of Omalisus fontisbellaquei]|nr:glycine--tRNA ligase subunit alpha [Rickettsia endosymbiont of Omalisus fontisbellaquei]